jgi:hypothetical protein
MSKEISQMERDISIIRKWVQFFGVLTAISLGIGVMMFINLLFSFGPL